MSSGKRLSDLPIMDDNSFKVVSVAHERILPFEKVGTLSVPTYFYRTSTTFIVSKDIETRPEGQI